MTHSAGPGKNKFGCPLQRCDYLRMFIHFAFSAVNHLGFAIVSFADVANYFSHGGTQRCFALEPLTELGRPVERNDFDAVKPPVRVCLRRHKFTRQWAGTPDWC